MELVDGLIDQFELVMNEIKVLEESGVPDDSPRMVDLLSFSNIVMGGMIMSARVGSMEESRVTRFQNIVKGYKGMDVE